MEAFLAVVVGFGICFGFIYLISYFRVRAANKPIDDFYEQQEIERQMKQNIAVRKNTYKMNSSARIDSEEFFSSDRSAKSRLFAEYLSDVCEENIPVIVDMFVKANPDKEAVESEITSFLYFSSYMLMQASDLDAREIYMKCSIQNDRHGRDDEMFWNRKMIYEDVYFGKTPRAYWDPSGNVLRENNNPLISCMMVMSDFIWEPDLKDSTDYDEYRNQPITIKSIDKAMEFQTIYAKVSMQIAAFMEMISETAHRLNLI